MDYNSIDEDDVDKLRLAALMTFKKKSNTPINTISSTSGEFSQNKFSNGNSYNNSARNNRGRFPASNRPFKQRAYTNVGFRRPTHANNNLIAIIPIDTESDSQTNASSSKVIPKDVDTKLMSCNTKSTNIQGFNNEVSTKFSRLDNESGSEESDDSETEKDGKDESDDGDVLLLGEEDEDLDDLDKLMDIMEAEIAGGDVKISKKDKRHLKHNNKTKKEKNAEFKNKSKLNAKTEPLLINERKIIENSKPQLNLPEEELESIKTVEEIRNSPIQCNYNLTDLRGTRDFNKSNIPFKSPSPNRKRSISPYIKLKRKRSSSPRSPRRRSPTPEKYRYSPVRSRLYRRSLSPRRSPRRLSPPREKNLSPRRYSPQKSRYPYRSPSPRRRRRSLSRDISPGRRRLSPLRRRSKSPLKLKSKSRSRSPKVRQFVRRRSPSPLKKAIRARPLSPISTRRTLLGTNTRRKDNEVLDDDNKKREKVKTTEKLVEPKPVDPILEARKRKFESNKPIEPTSKKIILKKTNSFPAVLQTENEELQNEKGESNIKSKSTHLSKKVKKSQDHLTSKNISTQMKKDLKALNLRRVVKVNSSPEKISNKRPRIVFGHETNNLPVDEENKNDQLNEKKSIRNSKISKLIPTETFEVSSTSDEELFEEEIIEENEDEECIKGDGQESSDCIEESIEEEEDGEEDVDDEEIEVEEEEEEEMHQVIDDKKDSLQHNNDNIDLRTELKRRRALRLNMIQVEVKKKPESFYPARLLQSAIRGVVGSSSANEVKRKKHSKIPEISIKTEGNSDGRRVIIMNREKTRTNMGILIPENPENYNQIESYASIKRLKGKLKKVPVRLRTTGTNNDNTIPKGPKKIIKRNINVTDFDQM